MKLVATAAGCLAMAMCAFAAPKPQMSQAEVNAILFNGLFSADRCVADQHWYSLNRAERDVLMKRVSLCMADSHAAMMSMTRPPTNDEVMAHLLGGLDAGEQATMRNIMAKCTMAQAEVGMKILENACMYGVGHAK